MPQSLSDIISKHGDHKGSLLPILHDVQATFGHVSAEAVRAIAESLNLSRAEVHGVVSFYHDFHSKPVGRHIVKFCRAESCQARGGAAIETRLVEALGTPMDSTSPDGSVTLKPAYCLGLCAIGPSALVDDIPFAGIDATAVAEISRQVKS